MGTEHCIFVILISQKRQNVPTKKRDKSCCHVTFPGEVNKYLSVHSRWDTDDRLKHGFHPHPAWLTNEFNEFAYGSMGAGLLRGVWVMVKEYVFDTHLRKIHHGLWLSLNCTSYVLQHPPRSLIFGKGKKQESHVRGLWPPFFSPSIREWWSFHHPLYRHK